MSKELWMAAHEKLIEEYMDAHPDADWTEAHDKTVDKAQGRMIDWLADIADAMKDIGKEIK